MKRLGLLAFLWLSFCGSAWAQGCTTDLSACPSPRFNSVTAKVINGPIAPGPIVNTTINNTPIGNTTPSTGAFTTLGVTGNAILGSINNTPVGNTAPNTGAFTALTGTSVGGPLNAGIPMGTGGNNVAVMAPGQLFVATSGNGGSDSNDCRTATVTGGHGPCLTPQHVMNVQIQLDNRGDATAASPPVINIGAGTFPGIKVWGQWRGGGGTQGPGNIIHIIGAGSSSTILSESVNVGTIQASEIQLFISAVTLKNTASSGSDIFGQNDAFINIGQDVVLGAATTKRIHLEHGALIETPYNMTIDGVATGTLDLSWGGRFEIDPVSPVFTCNGGANDTSVFATAQENSQIGLGGMTYSGCSGMTAAQFHLQTGSIMDLQGGDPLPGTTTNNLIAGYGINLLPGAAPTVTAGCGNIGSGGTCTLVAGSNELTGAILLTAGSGATGSDNITITFDAQIGITANNCFFTLVNGTGAWQNQATLHGQSNAKTTCIVAWSNNTTGLTNGSTYVIKYATVPE